MRCVLKPSDLRSDMKKNFIDHRFPMGNLFRKKSIVSIPLWFFPVLAIAGLFGPSSYDDCILEGVKSARTNTAVGMVYQACQSKFPPPPSPPQSEWHDFSYLKNDFSSVKKYLDNFVIHNFEIVQKNSKRDNYPYDIVVTNYLDIFVENKNKFNISGLIVGIPKWEGVCTPSKTDYKKFISCGGSELKSMGRNRLTCELENDNDVSSVCVFGFLFWGTEAEALSFANRYRIK